MAEGTWTDDSFRKEIDERARIFLEKGLNPYRTEDFKEPMGGTEELALDLYPDRFNKPESESWTYKVDNKFVKGFVKTTPWKIPSPRLPFAQCCGRCSDILHFDRRTSLLELRATSKDCQLCQLLLHAVERYSKYDPEITLTHTERSTSWIGKWASGILGPSPDPKTIRIFRDGSALKIGEDGPRILRLCSDIISYDINRNNGHQKDRHRYDRYHDDTDREDTNHDDIQIGFPKALEATNPMRFKLLRSWLRWCDKSHDCNKDNNVGPDTILPTRLLYVGDLGSDILILRASGEMDEEPYAALSHCWGNISSEDKQKFCTTAKNFDKRLEGFSVNELPQTFRDAVRVTRELGLHYLWIDSLCIIQDSNDDWKYECVRMEAVFASAYCTIAADSAASSYEGFLTRELSREHIKIKDTSGKPLCICDDIEDFNSDVEKAILNTRAWVLQERLLSRRIIHFSANFIYWECGKGVYCENLFKLHCPLRKQYFLLDPRFPERLIRSGDRRAVEFIQFLFEEYSNRGITKNTDRAIAIGGLEARISRALKCEHSFGIISRYRHRILLWQLADAERSKRIEYEDQKVPSWSWMAYSGGIQFMKVPFGDVEWINDLRFNDGHENTLVTEISKLRDVRIKREALQCVLLNHEEKDVGWLQYDVGGTDILQPHFIVVIGRHLGKYYVLAVNPTHLKNEYERIGIGMVQTDYVSRVASNVRIV